MTSMRRKRWNPRGKGWNPWGKTVEPTNRWFATVHEAAYFGPTTEISQIGAAASVLLRAVVPRCPAPTGDRVAPRIIGWVYSPDCG